MAMLRQTSLLLLLLLHLQAGAVLCFRQVMICSNTSAQLLPSLNKFAAKEYSLHSILNPLLFPHASCFVVALHLGRIKFSKDHQVFNHFWDAIKSCQVTHAMHMCMMSEGADSTEAVCWDPCIADTTCCDCRAIVLLLQKQHKLQQKPLLRGSQALLQEHPPKKFQVSILTSAMSAAS